MVQPDFPSVNVSSGGVRGATPAQKSWSLTAGTSLHQRWERGEKGIGGRRLFLYQSFSCEWTFVHLQYPLSHISTGISSRAIGMPPSSKTSSRSATTSTKSSRRPSDYSSDPVRKDESTGALPECSSSGLVVVFERVASATPIQSNHTLAERRILR